MKWNLNQRNFELTILARFYTLNIINFMYVLL